MRRPRLFRTVEPLKNIGLIEVREFRFLAFRQLVVVSFNYTGRFITFSAITNIYNKKTNWPTLMEFFTATGKLKTVAVKNSVKVGPLVFLL
jgi:hypothetical protein